VGPQADLESAKAWYRKALALGEPRARERLAGAGGETHAEAPGSVNTQ
jgi:TPR repeat protein